MIIRWDYQTISLDASHGWQGAKGLPDQDKMAEALNRLGEEGWELISTKDIEPTDGSATLFCLFKREKASELLGG